MRGGGSVAYSPSRVMRGPDPRIHVVPTEIFDRQDVDGRVKPGHDT
jgi:hypothetical protein